MSGKQSTISLTLSGIFYTLRSIASQGVQGMEMWQQKKCHPFLLSSEQYIYMKERSDTDMMETTIVKTSEPHQPALVLNCYVIWLRSKWGSKLTYFSNFAIYYLLVQLRVKSRLKRRAVKWVYFHSQPFSNRLNWRDDTFYTYFLHFLHLLFTLTFYTYFLH